MLSKTTIYILKSLSHIAALPEEELKGAKEIARELAIPANYLGKMLQILVKKGFLVSQKGLGGGFGLARPADEMTMLEVIEAVEEGPFLFGCFWGKEHVCSDDAGCVMHNKWKKIVEETRTLFETTTIQDLTTGIFPRVIKNANYNRSSRN